MIARLRAKTAKVPGIALFLQPVQDIRVGGRMTKSLYQYTLRSVDLDELNTWAPRSGRRVEEISRSLPTSIATSSSKVCRRPFSSTATQRGVLEFSPKQLTRPYTARFGQRQVSIMYGPQNQYRVVLEADPKYQGDPKALDKVFVRAASGQMVPLSSIAHYQIANVPSGSQPPGPVRSRDNFF